MPPHPFSLHVPDADITDLKVRLARTRLPDQAPDAPWSYGTDVIYLQNLLAYWQDGFDWRAQEARLNGFPQVRVPIAGIQMHALHVPGNGPDPMPLLLLHGWPGSVFEFLDIIPRLTDPARFGNDPADAFTVVAPSLPGYGLSFQSGQKRFGIGAMADAVTDLMSALGHQRFGAQGGDWGAAVCTKLGLEHAERIIGVHLNFLSAVRRDPSLFTDPAPEVQAFAAELAQFVKEETGYQVIQGTKPQTLAFALSDSPSGLAAWFVEKFRTWSDCAGEPETALTRDQMLADIAFYWFTGCIGASFWPYYERLHGPWIVPEGRTVDVPVGYAEFPREILHPPRSVAAQTFSDIRRWSVMPRGGHFAAMEQPAALAGEIRAFFRDLRKTTYTRRPND
jgi:pimeloyl-ACP methyl ester carboxylesterase